MIQPPRGARRPLLLASLCAAALLASCSGEAATAAKKKEEQGLKKREPTRVRVAAVEQRTMNRVLSTTTTVESEKEVRLFPRTSGVVVEVLAEEGSIVEEGAVLARLDARDKEAQLAEAAVLVREAEDAIQKAAISEREAAARVEGSRLAMEQATRDYERNDKANLISQAALDGLRLARDTKVSEHESARLALERSGVDSKAAATALEKAKLSQAARVLEHSYTRITAPFSGVIAERSVKVGDTVGGSAPVFVLTDILNLRAVLHRPQREFDLFTAAMRRNSDGGTDALEIRAIAEALPGAVFRGQLVRVSPSIDPSSGSFRVTVRLDSIAVGAPEKLLLPGMLVRVEVVTDRHPNALVVPKRALRREGENDILFVAREGKARRVVIEEGYAEEALVEVRPKEGALAAGDLVIIVGNRELEDGGEIEFEAARDQGATPAKAADPEPATAAETPKQG